MVIRHIYFIYKKFFGFKCWAWHTLDQIQNFAVIIVPSYIYTPNIKNGYTYKKWMLKTLNVYKCDAITIKCLVRNVYGWGVWTKSKK